MHSSINFLDKFYNVYMYTSAYSYFYPLKKDKNKNTRVSTAIETTRKNMWISTYFLRLLSVYLKSSGDLKNS